MAELLERPVDAGRLLAARTGVLAQRLADLLEALDSEALGSGSVFLRHMARRDAPATSGPPALDRLAGVLCLSDLEIELVLLAGLAEEHEGYAGVLRRIHPGGLAAPTAGLAAQVLLGPDSDRAVLRSVLLDGPAARAGVYALTGDVPFFERSLTLAPGLWDVLGDADVGPGMGSVRVDEALAAHGLAGWLDSAAVRRARAAITSGEPVTIVVTADSEDVALGRGRALVASAGAAEFPLMLGVAPDPALRDAITAHAVARGAVAVLAISTSADAPAQMPDFSAHPGAVVICARAGLASPHSLRPLMVIAATPLRAFERRHMWTQTLPDLADDAPTLAVRHAVDPQFAARAAADVRLVPLVEDRPATADDVAASVRGRASVALPPGARMRRPTAGWDCLVLAPDRLAQLREALTRLDHQARVIDDWGFERDRPGARGVRVLLAGAPGTGKTLSAEVLAHAVGADLIVVDISRVVSKWIGETEKNLAAIFDAAERSQAVLLFDEADALFGRRTDVSDAHDRYANLETAYLLTRLESFEGMTLLSTNLRQNIDPAFVRRLEFIVEYEEPAGEERRRLWDSHLAVHERSDGDVSLDELANRFAITGALIRNAAMAAAFLAAHDGTAITRRHLLRAIRREYDKTGRVFPAGPNHED